MIIVAELSGAALDYWVARALKISVAPCAEGWCRVESDPRADSGEGDYCGDGSPFRPSTDWTVAGPILAAARIGVMPVDEGRWGCPFADYGGYLCWEDEAATPLEAAMRHLVAAHLGSEFEAGEAGEAGEEQA